MTVPALISGGRREHFGQDWGIEGMGQAEGSLPFARGSPDRLGVVAQAVELAGNRSHLPLLTKSEIIRDREYVNELI